MVIVRPVLLGMALVASLGLGARDTSATHVRSRIPAAGPLWALPDLDAANTRAVGGPISAATVGRLRFAWHAPLYAKDAFDGGMSGTPLVVGPVVYLQDMRSNVEARSLRTGILLWRRAYNDPSAGPNGVAYAGGVIYGATESFAFALDARTGRQRWRSRTLPRNRNEGIDMAPGVFGGTVYVSTVPGNFRSFYTSHGAGVLWALDSATGKPRWSFRTVPFSLWGNPSVNSGGGLWEPPGFDGHGGVYVDIGNPGPTNAGAPGNVWARSRPGSNLYTNSLVKLDARTGRVLWHYQVIPHDLYDWDSQLPPIYDPRTRHVYIAGKYGRVLAFEASTGRLLWQTYVGEHSGHDHDDLLALRGQYARLPKFPFKLEPGEAGGVETPMAFAGETLYVPVVNVPYTIEKPGTSTGDFVKGTGEMVAIDAATGRRRWDRKLPSSPYGAATVVNNLVFTTDYSGQVLAFARATGKLVWSAQLSAGTNAQIVVAGDTLVTAASAPQPGQQPEIVAYRLGSATPPTGSSAARSSDGAPGTITDDGGLGIGTATPAPLRR